MNWKKSFMIGVWFAVFIAFLNILFLLNIYHHNPIQQTYMEHIVERSFLKQIGNFDVLEQDFKELYPFEYEHYFLLSPHQFRDLIAKSYDELILEQPCQWYSFLWIEYFRYNDIEYDLVWTNNHIFVIGYTDKNYMIADQNYFRIIQLGES